METKPLTIDLPADVHSFIELRAAMDDKRLKEATEELLTEIAMALKGKYKIEVSR